MSGPRKIATALYGTALATALAAAPLRLDLTGVPGIAPLQAMAQQGNGNGNGNGNDNGNGNSGNGNSGGNSGNGNSGNGNSGNGNSGNGNSGNGQGIGNGSPSDNDRGSQRRSGGADFGAGFGRRSNQHINKGTGDRIEINGSNIDVLHLDGMRERILNGFYVMTDAKGRTIIERRSTESDRARLRAMIR